MHKCSLKDRTLDFYVNILSSKFYNIVNMNIYIPVGIHLGIRTHIYMGICVVKYKVQGTFIFTINHNLKY